MDPTTPRRIPTLVVSGFLGSGKTTLVRALLAEAQAIGERLAVVVNDFGALGIDRALLGVGDARSVELAGGCVCCELSDELVETLETIRRDVAPDRIVDRGVGAGAALRDAALAVAAARFGVGRRRHGRGAGERRTARRAARSR